VRWPEFDAVTFLKAVQNKRARSGLECTYLPWPSRGKPKVGVKVFATASERTFARRMQAKAYKKDLAPEIGPAFRFSLVVPEARLFTERVQGAIQTYDTQDARLSAAFKRATFHAYWTQHAERVTHWSLALERLEASLRELGIDHWDLGPRNAGRIDGRLVCIDFGAESCDRCPAVTRESQ